MPAVSDPAQARPTATAGCGVIIGTSQVVSVRTWLAARPLAALVPLLLPRWTGCSRPCGFEDGANIPPNVAGHDLGKGRARVLPECGYATDRERGVDRHTGGGCLAGPIGADGGLHGDSGHTGAIRAARRAGEPHGSAGATASAARRLDRRIGPVPSTDGAR